MLKGSEHWTGWAQQKRAAAAFNIAAVSDIWLRGGSWTLDGSNNITSWTDLSGHGNHASIASAGPNGTSAVRNGHPGGRGNGSARLDFAGVTMGTSNTFCLVASRGSALAAVISWTPQREILSTGTGGEAFQWLNGGDNKIVAAVGFAPPLPHVVTVTQVDGASLVGYFDGAQAFSAVPTSTLNTRQINKLFCRDGNDLFTTADIYEVIHCPTALSPTDAAALYATLKSYYAL